MDNTSRLIRTVGNEADELRRDQERETGGKRGSLNTEAWRPSDGADSGGRRLKARVTIENDMSLGQTEWSAEPAWQRTDTGEARLSTTSSRTSSVYTRQDHSFRSGGGGSNRGYSSLPLGLGGGGGTNFSPPHTGFEPEEEEDDAQSVHGSDRGYGGYSSGEESDRRALPASGRERRLTNLASMIYQARPTGPGQLFGTSAPQLPIRTSAPNQPVIRRIIPRTVAAPIEQTGDEEEEPDLGHTDTPPPSPPMQSLPARREATTTSQQSTVPQPPPKTQPPKPQRRTGTIDGTALIDRVNKVVQGAKGTPNTQNTPYGTLTISRHVNHFLAKAEEYFECGESHLRECMGCKVQITNQATVDLQPEMAAVMMKFTQGWGHSSIFVQCTETSKYFNKLIVPAYNSRLAQRSSNGADESSEILGQAYNILKNANIQVSDDGFIEDLTSHLTTGKSKDFAESSSSSSITTAVAESDKVDDFNAELNGSYTLENLIKALFEASQEPITEWSERSVFDHFVFHINLPIITEFLLKDRVKQHIERLENIIYLQVPGSAGECVDEVVHKNLSAWQGLIGLFLRLNDRLSKISNEGSHVKSGVLEGLSSKSIVSETWRSGYITTVTTEDIYKQL